ncbi:hypothetical protein ILUMI_07025, partial [Ignelater luminosus]
FKHSPTKLLATVFNLPSDLKDLQHQTPIFTISMVPRNTMVQNPKKQSRILAAILLIATKAFGVDEYDANKIFEIQEKSFGLGIIRVNRGIRLFVYLKKELNIYNLGMLRQNRIGGYPLLLNKELLTEGREIWDNGEVIITNIEFQWAEVISEA